jgi:uncharacterized protein YjbI with pentapeptide repeats
MPVRKMPSIELLKRYSEGERTFVGANLSEASLLGADLAGADFTSADFSDAELFGADLSGADFSGADLSGADLPDADLRGAKLAGADLSGTVLSGADLSGAVLARANLTRAKLSRANLSNALLSDADLFGTDLSSANLKGTIFLHAKLCRVDLSGANMKRALFGETLCSRLLLRDARGLEETIHLQPSWLDLETLRACSGRLPRHFLTGCGLRDWEMEAATLYDPALRSEKRTELLYEIHRLQEGAPIAFHSVFISHSTIDEGFCTRLHGDLQNKGVRCWFAPHDIQAGKKIHEQIERGIHIQDRLLLVLSEASMSSTWVKTEIANARQKEREQNRAVLFPIRLVSFDKVRAWKLFDADAGSDAGREVREYYIPDFSEWRDESKYRPEFERLVNALRAVDEPDAE